MNTKVFSAAIQIWTTVRLTACGLTAVPPGALEQTMVLTIDTSGAENVLR